MFELKIRMENKNERKKDLAFMILSVFLKILDHFSTILVFAWALITCTHRNPKFRLLNVSIFHRMTPSIESRMGEILKYLLLDWPSWFSGAIFYF